MRTINRLLNRTHVENAFLLKVLANFLFDSLSLRNSKGASDNEQKVVNDVISEVFPKLSRGLDVNVKFCDGISGFEYTSEMDVFDLLRVRLVHGWCVDPENKECFECLKSISYNQLIEKVIMHKCNEDKQSSLPEEKSSKQSSSSHSSSTNSSQSSNIVLSNFYDRTPSQLTYYGLSELHNQLKKRELAVLFRNNHFSTIFCGVDNQLYTLMTDLGYHNSRQVVWSRLQTVDGDALFFNSRFERSVITTDALRFHSPRNNMMSTNGHNFQVPVQHNVQTQHHDPQVQRDHLIALSLQLEGQQINRRQQQQQPIDRRQQQPFSQGTIAVKRGTTTVPAPQGTIATKETQSTGTIATKETQSTPDDADWVRLQNDADMALALSLQQKENQQRIAQPKPPVSTKTRGKNCVLQ